MTAPGIVMNPNGLSRQAIARKRRSSSDLPLPDLDDAGAVSKWRTEQHEQWGEHVAPGEPAHDPVQVAGVQCLRSGPPGDRTLVYLHGGGFCLGSPGTALPITARLARNFPVVSVDYRLSPEHRCPEALEDVIAVCNELSLEAPFLLAGDSAGGNLAITAALEMADRELRGPDALLLLCPHLDFRQQLRGTSELAPMALGYLGDRSPADPLASPLARSDDSLVNLPPTLVQTTADELMHGQALELARRAPESVALQIWHGLWHAWHYHRELPEAWDAIDRAARWLAPMGNGQTGTVESNGR